MNSQSLPKRERGQTIIIAMVVLGVLLILGFVFVGIIDRNNKSAFTQGNRSVANDLALGGIRYAHQQLLQSELGADWRGTPTNLGTGTATLDPDIYYLRPPATLTDGTPLPIAPGSSQIDLGGPDGLGSYFRVNNSNGRTLVRVRYAPSDATIFSSSPVGPLRRPGLARNYIIIESVGRQGVVNTSDPTTLTSGTPVQFASFADDQTFRASVGIMRKGENHYPNTQVIRAFASIGIIESARFVHNKYNVTRAADLGYPKELSAQYNGTPVSSILTYQLGNTEALYNLGNPPTPAGQIEGNGSCVFNCNVIVHGTVRLNLNRYLGDQFDVAGQIKGDLPDPSVGYQGGQLQVAMRDVLANGTWGALNTQTLTEGGASSLDSNSPGFTTVQGTVRDGSAATDQSGGPRSVGYKAAPSIEITDPDTGENRYVGMTSDSGNNGSGRFGFGGGVFVNNPSDVQVPSDEAGRTNSGTEESLFYDWLNPNNGQAHSGWQGFLYNPPAATVRLQDDGFYVTRNGQGPTVERTWRFADGSDTNNPTNRFRIGLGSDGRRHIVNGFTPVNPGTATPVININANLGATDYDKGPIFTGVVYFAGNLRIRGIIPTDVQMTMVSNGTIYIDGSITKGVTANGLQPTEGVPVGQVLTRPTKSTLMLMAKDNVAINTTQFCAPSTGQQADLVNDTPNLPGYDAIRIHTAGSLLLDTEFVRDPLGPGANASNPRTQRPYEFDYSEFGVPARKIPTSLLLAHTMDNGGAEATFFQMDVNFGGADPSPYFFLRAGNTAGNYIAGISTTLPVYGLGSETYQTYSRFEAMTFPVIDPSTMTMSADNQRMISNNFTGNYSFYAEGLNQISIQQTSVAGIATNDYLVGRTALVPHDVRIEAALFAEEGSFFVIPGPWFNPDSNDRRDNYVNSIGEYAGAGSTAEKDAIRLANHGATTGMPFYGEPLDVRVVISGAVSENMPPPASVQAEWLKKWGWLPRDLAATGSLIPGSHVPLGYNIDPANPNSSMVVPNLIINYDPVLATGRSNGFVIDNSPNTLIRVDDFGRPLPPMPRLPVSPTLAYFGEVH